MEESTVEGHESLIADAAPLSGPSGKNGQPQQGSQQDITADEARDKAPGNTGDTGDTAEMHGTGQTDGSATEETDKMNGSGTDSRPVRKPQEEYREDFWNDTDFRKDRSRKRSFVQGHPGDKCGKRDSWDRGAADHSGKNVKHRNKTQAAYKGRTEFQVQHY